MRVYNFSAGPAVLPEAVLLRAQKEMLEKNGHGMSVMEMSHRSPMYEEIIFGARDALRRLMNISDDYEVLFLQGGAMLQFAQAPMNLKKNGLFDYVVTGVFAKKAAEEAALFGKVHVVASSADQNFSYIPKLSRENFDPNADYVHITTNNTIVGTSYRTNLPDTGRVPLVADMSSNILSEVYDVNRFGLIYAGAQKNIGPAGVTIVIVRKDLLQDELQVATPSVMRYMMQAKNDSMLNTPPTYGIYMAGLVFDHLEKMGGVPAIQKINEHKAAILYDALDNASLFICNAAKEDRSMMNVTFALPTDELNKEFIKEASENGMVNLKGHRVVGGMRASIYNAMPIEGVQKLADFITKFQKTHG